MMMHVPPRVLVFAQSTAAAGHRSGVHRVATELARGLQGFADVDLVKWDKMAGQLTFFDQFDFDKLGQRRGERDFGEVHPHANRVNSRFGDSLDAKQQTWLLYPEIAYHLPDGNDIFRRILSQCREYDVKVASIFYDIIPIKNDDYSEIRAHHTRYVNEMIRSDLIIPISNYSKDELLSYYSTAVVSDRDGSELSQRIRPVLLPEGARKLAGDQVAARDTMLLLGSIEPRKQQVDVLEAFNELAAEYSEVADLQVTLVGSVHPMSAPRLQAAMAANPKIQHFDYAPDSFIDECYRTAKFTVFASKDEGYGLPIAESVARGVPCLTANFGSMAEVAKGGGCLTADVTSKLELKTAIWRLVCEHGLLRELTTQIENRSLRTWENYSREIVDLLSDPDIDHAPETARPSKGDAQADDGVSPKPPLFLVSVMDEDLDEKVVCEAIERVRASGKGAYGCDVSGSQGKFATLSKKMRSLVYEADALTFASAASLEEVLAVSKTDKFRGILPTRMSVERKRSVRLKALEKETVEISNQRAKRDRWAVRERQLMQVDKRCSETGEASKVMLDLVISTYNRSDFVNLNARWLAQLILPFDGRVRLTVVDNTSTDDSWFRIQDLAGAPHVRLMRNPNNRGMLGNLNVCSKLIGADHVWIVGDDDFIVPGTLEKVVQTIAENPSIPLIFNNFSVYHRERLGELDTAVTLIGEGMALASKPSPSGRMSVKHAAMEHDNLFTAVYPIIWRSDILAACFNYPFTGVPFGDLTECVPTTQILLESYSEVDCYWLGDVGIAANAHNSWSRHRPRWHGVLMPLVFELASRAGLDKSVLYSWSRAHRKLFDEAVSIAKDHNLQIHIDEGRDGHVWQRIYRERFKLPADVKKLVTTA